MTTAYVNLIEYNNINNQISNYKFMKNKTPLNSINRGIESMVSKYNNLIKLGDSDNQDNQGGCNNPNPGKDGCNNPNPGKDGCNNPGQKQSPCCPNNPNKNNP